MDGTGSGYYVMGYISYRMSGGWNWLRLLCNGVHIMQDEGWMELAQDIM